MKKMTPFFPDSIVKQYTKNEKLILVFTNIKNILVPINIKKISEKVNEKTITNISCDFQNLENKLNILKELTFDFTDVSITVLDNQIKIICENFECSFASEMILEIQKRFKNKTK